MMEHRKEKSSHSFTFKILGDEYVIRGNDSPEYMQELALYIEQAITEITVGNPKLNKSQITVLAALKIADELQKLRLKYQYLDVLLEDAR